VRESTVHQFIAFHDIVAFHFANHHAMDENSKGIVILGVIVDTG
jgi:hypothetical protein